MRKELVGNATLYNADCLEILPTLSPVDMVLADPPYGTTACKWDTVIDLDAMWAGLKQCTKPNAAIVMTASQPFTSALVMSNAKWFRHEWVWDKVNKYTGSLQANKRRLRRHEDIVVFSEKPIQIYNKQWREGRPFKAVQTKGHGGYAENKKPHTTVNEGKHNPCSILPIPGDNKREAGSHPTQKPVALMEYLIRTYTNEGETVLDFTMGSGTTGVACANLGRKFIGIELDADYFDIACRRIEEAQRQEGLFAA